MRRRYPAGEQSFAGGRAGSRLVLVLEAAGLYNILFLSYSTWIIQWAAFCVKGRDRPDNGVFWTIANQL